MKKIKLTFILFLIAALSGLLISFVNDVTMPVIDKNAKQKELSLYEELFADINTFDKNEDVSDLISEQVKILDSNDNVIGYVYKASGVNGYGSITVLVGIDNNGKLKGIKYSQFAQTPGFGDKVKEDVFVNQFMDVDASDYQVDGQAGATYSSNLVKEIVNTCTTYHNENVK